MVNKIHITQESRRVTHLLQITPYLTKYHYCR